MIASAPAAAVGSRGCTLLTGSAAWVVGVAGCAVVVVTDRLARGRVVVAGAAAVVVGDVAAGDGDDVVVDGTVVVVDGAVVVVDGTVVVGLPRTTTVPFMP